MKLSVLTFLFVILLASCTTTRTYAVDVKDVEKQITTSGATGWIHGAVSSQGLFVFTYRNPTDFFDYIEMSLVTDDPLITKQLEALNRHDKVKIKGTFLDIPAPQKHIHVNSVEMVKKFQGSYDTEPYSHEAKVPDELIHKDSGLFLVHAIGADGHILVVEYKDTVLPVFVKNADLTKKLFRNDLVQLKFGIQAYPDQPVHLTLTETAPQPVQVVESIQAKNGQPFVMEGALILFPKSPEIMFNVFAVEQQLPEGLKRQYTLVNFDNPDTFAQIRGLLQKTWDNHPGAYVNGRNKLVSKVIRVKATGIFNEVSVNQANAQILLKDLSSIEILDH